MREEKVNKKDEKIEEENHTEKKRIKESGNDEHESGV